MEYLAHAGSVQFRLDGGEGFLGVLGDFEQMGVEFVSCHGGRRSCGERKGGY